MSNIHRSGTRKRLRSWVRKGIGIAALVVVVAVAIPLIIRFFLADGQLAETQSSPRFDAVRMQPAAEVVMAVHQGPEVVSEAEVEESFTASSEINGEWRGVCKKESIRSVDDFRRLVYSDIVLASHFAGFDWQAARLGRQERDVFAFVSHRKGDVIKLTTKPIKLPKGDGYITDGVRIVRTYCCNDYTVAPVTSAVAGVAQETPPVVPPQLPASLPVAETFVDELPIIPAVVGRSLVDPTPLPPPTGPIPEPGTMLLMGTGLMALAYVCRRKKS